MNAFLAFIVSFVIVLILIFLISLAFKYTKTCKKSRKSVYTSDLRTLGKTGDLLLFSSNNRVIGFVKALFGTEFVHSGILYFKPGDRTPYVWESARTPDTKKDHVIDEISGTQKSGVQLRNLEKLVEAYDGYVVHVPLRPSFEDMHGEEEIQRIFGEVMDKYKNSEFVPRYSWMIASALLSLTQGSIPISSSTYRNLRNSLVPEGSMLCTELTMGTYEALGIWKESQPKIPPEIHFAHHFLFHGYLGDKDWDFTFELLANP